MRKRSLLVFLVVGLLLVGCNNPENASTDENPEPRIMHASRPTYTLEQTAKEADIIANITVTKIVDVLEHEYDEDMFIEFTEYEATINHYFYDNLDYGEEINFIQSGSPNFLFDDDPLFEVGETYIIFLNEVDSEFGEVLGGTGGPQGRYNKVDDIFVRQVSPLDDTGLDELTEPELIQAINERSDEINIDLNTLE
ncbi:uncharacterized protein YcfL [Natronobacillus azotifigens]|uniref:Uncharacterized protein n=1 Tax=Natronobacillus azotifigens TaxID=472978 RepID=A0A9J6RD61_9BACI|nr:hypothetical protein [Natronobacillus azotifigens]MCZ0703437.1 hypothetical protein [Natronobacillus azotifigens]